MNGHEDMGILAQWGGMLVGSLYAVRQMTLPVGCRSGIESGSRALALVDSALRWYTRRRGEGPRVRRSGRGPAAVGRRTCRGSVPGSRATHAPALYRRQQEVVAG